MKGMFQASSVEPARPTDDRTAQDRMAILRAITGFIARYRYVIALLSRT